MANIFYQKLKCLLSVASNVYLIKLILQLHMVIKKTISSLVLYNCFSTFAQSFLNFATKMHYVWQGVSITISWQIYLSNQGG